MTDKGLTSKERETIADILRGAVVRSGGGLGAIARITGYVIGMAAGAVVAERVINDADSCPEWRAAVIKDFDAAITSAEDSYAAHTQVKQ